MTDQSIWDFDIKFLKGVGPKIAALFYKNDIHTLWDLLLMLPKSYEDRSKIFNYEDIQQELSSNKTIFARAEILKYQHKQSGPRGRRWLEAIARIPSKNFAANSALAPLVHFTWFHNPQNYIEKTFPVGTHVFFQGKPTQFKGQIQFSHPEFQKTEAAMPVWEFGGSIPIYREVQGLTSKMIRKLIYQSLQRPELNKIPETLPSAMLAKYNFPTLAESIRQLHFPNDWIPSSENPTPGGHYYTRIVFEELFVMSLALHLRRSQIKHQASKKPQSIPQFSLNKKQLDAYSEKLPFRLTDDQNKVLEEIFVDCFKANQPMHRLVQGDVGSGKTIVAFLSALAAMKSGFQAALMAPTEILADQHYANFKKLFPEFSSQCALLKGSLTVKQKKELREKIQNGSTSFVIGTQALLSESTHFQKLGLIIVDEQHRFGVEQRISLKEQSDSLNFSPHLLVMTATPIPRSLALTLYGDLNLSFIKQKPAGRTPIQTHIVKQKSADALFKRVEKFLAEKRQLYVVYPLIEESEELDLSNAQDGFKEWQSKFPETKIGLLHGKIKSADKESIMSRFKAQEFQILICTTVIEVGVDVPNASVIIINHAERFGLSQLHQLRGRVGRGSTASYCILMAPNFMGELTERRLKTIEQSEDGFYIAEQDLEIRGPGEFLGRRQSGMPGFRVAHILRDSKWLEVARSEAENIFEKDPALQLPENSKLNELISHWWKDRLELTLSG